MNEIGLNIRKLKNKTFTVVIALFTILTALPLIFIIYYVFRQGIAAINWQFFITLPKPVGESGGGIANALLGTVLIVLVASVMAVPIGIMAGVYMSENPDNRISRSARLAVEVLNGVPSIVIGIFAYLVVVIPTGGFSSFSGSFALAVMMLPLIIRTTEETLQRVPKALKESALALGAPYYRVIFKVVIPSGLSGIINGVMLAVARVTGETAPLLFTAFGNPYLNWNISKPMANLPLLIFNYATSPYKNWHRLAWGASLILIIFVLLLNITSRLAIKKWKIRF
ncbi:MAG TPA: phosphate ABC transporter permease PstA [Balneolaceae bacterium]|nr:phosphate ABC transporter permease PstA [Balneolaceae bacterium]